MYLKHSRSNADFLIERKGKRGIRKLHFSHYIWSLHVLKSFHYFLMLKNQRIINAGKHLQDHWISTLTSTTTATMSPDSTSTHILTQHLSSSIQLCNSHLCFINVSKEVPAKGFHGIGNLLDCDVAVKVWLSSWKHWLPIKTLMWVESCHQWHKCNF